MIKRITFTLIACLSLQHAMAQVSGPKNELRIGYGRMLLGTGDMSGYTQEMEYNRLFTPHFSYGVLASMGRSTNGVFLQSSYSNAGANLYYSIYKPEHKSNLRIGTGLHYYAVSDFWMSSAMYNSLGELIAAEYTYEKRKSAGVNVSLEYQIAVQEKLMCGVKVFTTPYFNGDIASGVQARLGLRF